MSNHLGLAATVATLQQLLASGFAALKLDDLLAGSLSVSCIAPERIPAAATNPQLNLFLYNQTRNSGWHNSQLPSRDSQGERLANPPLALDLHLLLAAYGVADFQAEVMLGAAMQLLHEQPVLGRSQIRELLTPAPAKPNLPAEFQLAGLADQLEQLRITAVNLNTDEISRIWSMLQTPARPSAAYQLSVVLMSSSRPTRAALPVTSRNLYAQPLRAPRIDRIEAQGGAAEPITTNSQIRLSGLNLRSNSLQLLVAGIDLSSTISELSDSSLLFALRLPPPAGTVPEALRAGSCTLQLVHQQLMGEPARPHGGQGSNLAAFVLSPQASFSLLPGVVATLVDGVTYHSGTLRITASPRLGRRQQLRLLLNERHPPDDRPARAYSFAAVEGNGISLPADSSATVDIDFGPVVAGRYLLRLEVDGAASGLSLGADGRFDAPELLL